MPLASLHLPTLLVRQGARCLLACLHRAISPYCSTQLTSVPAKELIFALMAAIPALDPRRQGLPRVRWPATCNWWRHSPASSGKHNSVLGRQTLLPTCQGLWWNSAESGWGIDFAHQGDQIFASLVHVSTRPAKRVAIDARNAFTTSTGNAYAGTIFVDRGPRFDNFRAVRVRHSSCRERHADVYSTQVTDDWNTSSTRYRRPSRFPASILAPGRRQSAGPATCPTWPRRPTIRISGGRQTERIRMGDQLRAPGNSIFATWYTSTWTEAPFWLSGLMDRVAGTNTYAASHSRHIGPHASTITAPAI